MSRGPIKKRKSNRRALSKPDPDLTDDDTIANETDLGMETIVEKTELENDKHTRPDQVKRKRKSRINPSGKRVGNPDSTTNLPPTQNSQQAVERRFSPLSLAVVASSKVMQNRFGIAIVAPLSQQRQVK